MQFFVYLLEAYAEHKGKTADVVFSQWKAAGLSSFFFDMYERYHAEALENAFADIDDKMAEVAA